MEPRWFDVMVQAYEDKRKYEFEMTRAMTYLICSYPNGVKKNMHPAHFWPSPFEKTPELVDKWQNIDPEVLANFNRNADDTLAKMSGSNGVN